MVGFCSIFKSFLIEFNFSMSVLNMSVNETFGVAVANQKLFDFAYVDIVETCIR